MPVSLGDRIVEVIADLGESAAERYRYGSGCIVRGGTVLTAAHVVTDAVRVWVRDPDKRTFPASADPRFVGDVNGPGPDLALVEIDDPKPDLPPVGLARVDRDSSTGEPVERCQVIGYPAFMEEDAPDGSQIRETADALGHVPVLSRLARGLLSVQVSQKPRPLPPEGATLGQSEWSGMSGAPVVADGLLLGVVSEHAPREGPSAITATPLTALEADSAHAGWGPGVADPGAWWARLGVSGMQELRRLPERRPTLAATTRTLPRDVACFTDREDALEKVASALSEGAVPGGVMRIRAINGMAGVGKTAFAVHAAQQVASHFPDGQILLRLHGHTPGQEPVVPTEALAALLETIGVPAPQIPDSLDARSGVWRDRLAGKKMLLLLDDAVSSDQVDPLVPAAAETLVLITSRRRLGGLSGAVQISLDVLEPAEAAQLFSRLADRPDLPPTDSGVAQVVGLCGYLPLAISLTAGRLKNHPAWTTNHLAAKLADATDRLKAMSADEDASVSVAAAFNLSYDDLTRDQQRLFRYLGLHPGSDIDAFATSALVGTDPEAAGALLDGLYGQNLIDEPTPERYRLHDLIRQHARALAAQEAPAEQERAIGRLMDYYLRTGITAGRYLARHTPAPAQPIDDPPIPAPKLSSREKAIDWLEAERFNLQAVTDYAALDRRSALAIQIPAALAGFLRVRGYWDQARTLQETALGAAQRTGDRHGEADALNNLAGVQQATGNYSAASANHTRALVLYRDLGDWRGEANALSDLAIVQRLTGDYASVISGLTRAQILYRDLGDNLGQAKALNDLGIVYRLTGDYPAAYRSLTEALNLHRSLGSGLGEANALNDLGIVYRLTGDYPAADRSLTEALNLQRSLGSRHGEANALKDLGVLYQMKGDYPAADRSLTEAQDLFHELGDRNCEAETLNNRGQLLTASSTAADARACFAGALEIARAINAPREEARALEGIGQTCLQEGELQEGEIEEGTTHLRQALAIYRRLGSPDVNRVEEILRSDGST